MNRSADNVVRRDTLILIVIICLKVVVQYVLVNPVFDLHRDEYLHLDQSNHLAAGYISVPPFSSWVAVLIRWLGNSAFWVRFFPALFGALTIATAWKIAEALGGGLYAKTLTATALFISALLRLNMLFQPNSMDILCWTLLFYVLIQFVRSDDRQWLYLGGIVLAAGILNKYNILFLLIGLLAAFLLSPHRRVFLNREFHYAMGITAILVLPNLIWQFNNHFPVVAHMNELARTQLVNVSRADFLKEQTLYFIGAVYLIVLGAVSVFIYPPYKPYRFVFWAFLFTLLVFLYFRAKGYYAMGLYPVMIAFGACYFERLFYAGWKRYVRIAPFVIILLFFIPIVDVAFPLQTPEKMAGNSAKFKKWGMLRWEDGQDHQLPQDFADMLGWSELAGIVDSAYLALGDPTGTLVLCDNYGQTGAINYYSHIKHINAVSMNADYINWIPLDHEIRNVILVASSNDDDKSRNKERALFKEIHTAGMILNKLAREYQTTVYVLKGATQPIVPLLREEVKQRRIK